MSVIDEIVLDHAEQYSDLHIDLRDPMDKSVVFLSSGTPGNNGLESLPMKVPQVLEGMIALIVQELHKLDAEGKKSFSLAVGGLRYRCTRIREFRYALRRLSCQVRQLDQLNLTRAATDILLDPEFRSGLILICGETGSGKSTTAQSAVVARLEKFGGYCLTAESPVEVELEGFHGKGYVEQIDVSEAGYREEIASAMRKFPAATRSMFFFGEVIEPEGAAELVRLIGRGHLVITTIHAKDEMTAIVMLVAFAERGGETYARQLIGSNLKAVIHQKLVSGQPKIQCFKANDQVKNTISNATVSLETMSTAISQIKSTAVVSLRATR